ncbi:MAG: response regulator [Elusimicrobiota bacterium]|jgi:two-component system KDP operon response regulator KdpE
MRTDERTILVVEDEAPILRFLRSALQAEGLIVVEAVNGRSALELAASRKPDMVLLDLMLPDMDGIDVLKRLRRWTAAPVIILSAKGQESDKIAGLDAGADDYLTKPFGVAELLARIRVAFRHAERKPEDPPPIHEHEGLKVDLAARRVWVRKKEVHLSPLQYDLLAVLVRNAGRVVGHKQLIKEVWHEAGEASPESVRICVHQLRHRIESDPVRPRHIKTESGVGYRLEAPGD